MNIEKTIAAELSVNLNQVIAAIKLLDEGATVPFISRYRKEATGGLSDTDLRNLEERLTYLRELEERKTTILKSIKEQDKLTPALKAQILEADNKSRLEDLYLPYKPKRRTKGQIAIEAGLELLAELLLKEPLQDAEKNALKFLNDQVATVKDALDGARYILMERFAENADIIAALREYFWKYGVLSSKVLKDKEEIGIKFKDYFEYQEPIAKIPSHRALAFFRGRREDVLRLSLVFLEDYQEAHCIQLIAETFHADVSSPFLKQTVEWTWKIKLHTKLEMELMTRLKEKAEEEAIRVFKENLKNLLMASPAGHHVTIGLDPGLRTGVKVVVVDGTGKLLHFTTIFPHAPKDQWNESIAVLEKLAKQYQATLVSIGNGTASRETDRLVAEVIKKNPDLNLIKIMVSEAGASVYSASELAAKEFPDLDVTYRGAVSIARRLQDPLAELVKIDPKSIGVGQYQHDVNQIHLGKSLSAAIEDCVNAVGADANTASVPLLKSISGLNDTLAKNIVDYREANGRFKTREALKKVARMGDKTFEQAVGFLRIIGGDHPLDASAVHPESYPLVEDILKTLGKPIEQVMGNTSLLRGLKPEKLINEKFGLPTIKDVLSELEKPGRDPRPEFKTAVFKDGVEKITDLKPEMILEGVVTNVTNFGAFVDIGVHQDGLVHISQLANHYVDDPNKVVKAGQVVKVKVQEIDPKRNRIALTMRLDSNFANALSSAMK